MDGAWLMGCVALLGGFGSDSASLVAEEASTSVVWIGTKFRGEFFVIIGGW